MIKTTTCKVCGRLVLANEDNTPASHMGKDGKVCK